jgi:hypothetical protein
METLASFWVLFLSVIKIHLNLGQIIGIILFCILVVVCISCIVSDKSDDFYG